MDMHDYITYQLRCSYIFLGLYSIRVILDPLGLKENRKGTPELR